MIYRGLGFSAVVRFALAPPTPPLPSHVSELLSFLVFLCVTGRAYRQQRGREGPNRTTARKPGPLLLYHSMLSALLSLIRLRLGLGRRGGGPQYASKLDK